MKELRDNKLINLLQWVVICVTGMRFASQEYLAITVCSEGAYNYYIFLFSIFSGIWGLADWGETNPHKTPILRDSKQLNKAKSLIFQNNPSRAPTSDHLLYLTPIYQANITPALNYLKARNGKIGKYSDSPKTAKIIQTIQSFSSLLNSLPCLTYSCPWKPQKRF